jgi:hypothetical protein
MQMTDKTVPTVAVIDLGPAVKRQRELGEAMRTDFHDFLQKFAVRNGATLEETIDLVLGILHEGTSSQEHG